MVIIEQTKDKSNAPQFHPRGFYMNWGYVFDRGSASGRYQYYQGTGADYEYMYLSHGLSFNLGGKVFSKKKLSQKFQIGADLSSTTQFCFVTLFTQEFSDPFIMFCGIKAGPSLAWNFNNTRFVYITPMVGVDYFGLTIGPSSVYNGQLWAVDQYSWNGAFAMSVGLKVEYVIKRFSFGTSCFYNPTFTYNTLPSVVSRIQYSAFVGFMLSYPSSKKKM